MSPQPKNEPAIAPAPSSSSADPPPFNCHPSLPQEILDSWRDFNPEWLKDPILMPDEVPDDWIDVEPLEWPPGLFDDAKDSGAAAKADGGEKTEEYWSGGVDIAIPLLVFVPLLPSSCACCSTTSRTSTFFPHSSPETSSQACGDLSDCPAIVAVVGSFLLLVAILLSPKTLSPVSPRSPHARRRQASPPILYDRSQHRSTRLRNRSRPAAFLASLAASLTMSPAHVQPLTWERFSPAQPETRLPDERRAKASPPPPSLSAQAGFKALVAQKLGVGAIFGGKAGEGGAAGGRVEPECWLIVNWKRETRSLLDFAPPRKVVVFPPSSLPTATARL
ncbi:Proteophosphoglycan ppg4 [Rhodotorula toruloides ATCC 204091]|uniref:Proteophosphoglycan ppg4 n=1 Tax=Rhodotorula toruloides TaxID=5286 RepID=A0A2T0AIN7_RHOTO|nr:Proteophosphoglycan ppg4 [Rhodotorula toruloides ATCC 204091]PRQ77820.1 Proteophosphoglycan ppg4 [Rhodotorula toruloides]